MIVGARPIPSLPGRTRITAAVLVGLLVAACTAPPEPSEAPRTGGTLRVALVEYGSEAHPGLPYYEPSRFFDLNPLWRCCLLRTLLSYNGRSTEEGGAELRPDLAAGLPEISPDGLTWTFRLRPDIRYAPPLADRVIEARDFVTALEYGARHGDPLPSPIVGIGEYADGQVDTIAGVEAPDSTTLVVHLERPSGEFGGFMATAPTAPMPAEALAAAERQGYAGFLVASGPYMYEHAADIDLSDPAGGAIWSASDGPVSLIRNPSWQAEQDPLRGAYVDRIDVVLAPDLDAAVELVETGEADVLGEPAPADVVDRYLGQPDLQDRVFTEPSARVHYIAMNLAVPPFDDVHVRRSVNWILDRSAIAAGMREERNEGFVVARHAFPDSLLNNLLVDYAPYATTGDRGDLRLAQEEIRASAYDTDGDGVCDDPACAAVSAFYASPSPATNDLITEALAQIGIQLTPTEADPFDPEERIAALVGIGWAVDLPRADNFAGLLAGRGLPGSPPNVSMLGATPEQLAGWGYQVTDVPSLDPVIGACLSAVGSQSFECWAGIDQLVMERVVAWAPFAFLVNGWITSDRVSAFSADVYGLWPSIDRVQLREEP